MKAISTNLIALTALIFSSTAAACKCGDSGLFEQAIAGAEVVVLAQLQEVEDLGPGAGHLKQLKGTFVAEQTFKGIVAPQFNVSTAKDGASCGVRFIKSQPYLLILDGKNWTISSCDHGGLIPKDLTHHLGHEIETILKDPGKAVADAKALEQNEIWLKSQGPDLFALKTKLNACAAEFDVDKQVLQKRIATIDKAQKLWFDLMASRMDNPKVMNMLGQVLNKQANTTLEQQKQAGQFNKITCDAALLDGSVDEIFQRMQTFQ